MHRGTNGRHVRSFFALTVAVALATSGWLSASPFDQKHAAAKLDRALARLSPDDAATVRVIVSTKPGRRQGVAGDATRGSARLLTEHPAIDALTLELPASEIAELAAHPEVERVSLDAPVKSYADQVGTLDTNMLLPTLGLPQSGLTGAGVGVAVIDSGIVSHNEIVLAAFYDFLNGGRSIKPFDLFGHGTHVAGMIQYQQSYSTSRYRGIAKGARLIGLRALDGQGAGYTSTVIQAIEFAIANKTKLGIDVINLSLGHPVYESAATDPLVRAVERAVAAGIVVVVSAGNEGMSRTTGEAGYGGVTSPGNAPSAITVGAVDTRNTITRTDDQVPVFSSRGPTWYDGFAKPDLVAPGRRVVSFMAKNSTLYNTYQPYRVDVATRTYMTLSGTSMSAAVTSGVVALMIEASRLTNPGRIALPPNAIKAVLQYTASPLSGVDELTQGAGSLNPAGALALAGAIDPTQPVGAWWLKFGVSSHSRLSNGEEIAWGQQILWGDHVLTGDTVYVNQPAWSKAIVWGNSVVWGNSIVWGNAIVWGNSVVWGNAIVWGNTIVGYNTGGGVQYGDQVDWSNVDPNSIVWGNLSGVSQLPTSKSVNQFTPVW